MHPSAEVNNSPEAQVDEVGALSLQLISPSGRPSTAVSFGRVVFAVEVIADLLTIVLGVTLGYHIYESVAIGKHVYYSARLVYAVGAAFAVVIVLMLDRVGAYRRGNSLLRVRETEQVLRVSTQGLLIVLSVSFFSSILFARWLLVLCFTLVPLLIRWR